jgi:hypothetical protein
LGCSCSALACSHLAVDFVASWRRLRSVSPPASIQGPETRDGGKAHCGNGRGAREYPSPLSWRRSRLRHPAVAPMSASRGGAILSRVEPRLSRTYLWKASVILLKGFILLLKDLILPKHVIANTLFRGDELIRRFKQEKQQEKDSANNTTVQNWSCNAYNHYL